MRYACGFLLVALLISLPSSAYEIKGQVASGNFTWSPQNFPGFYYDIDDNIGAETLTVTLTGDNKISGAAPNGIVYSTKPLEKEFGLARWGHYDVLGLFGERYFVGYSGDSGISKAREGTGEGLFLGRVLVDSDRKWTISSNESLDLGEGYSLKLEDSDSGVNVSLYRGGSVVDFAVIQPPTDYIYTRKVGGRNVTLIAARVESNVKLSPLSYYTLKGLFQLSENFTHLETGSSLGAMVVKSAGDEGLVMVNRDEMELTKGSDIGLFENMSLRISRSDELRYYLFRDVPDQRLVRGAVAEGDFLWNPENFAGFYYDLDDNLGTEALAITITEGRRLSGDAPYGMQYVSSAQKKKFEFDDWGSYDLLGFLGEAYFAGCSDGTGFGGEEIPMSFLGDGLISRVLLDESRLNVVESGGRLSLADGFEAELMLDDGCQKAFVELYKNGEPVHRDYFDLPYTYVYKADLGSLEDVPILALHFAGANCTGGKFCLIDGIFQLSDEPVSVRAGEKFGRMAVTSFTPDTIVMENRDRPITLNRNVDISLMPGISVKVADSDELRYYIYRNSTEGGIL